MIIQQNVPIFSKSIYMYIILIIQLFLHNHLKCGYEVFLHSQNKNISQSECSLELATNWWTKTVHDHEKFCAVAGYLYIGIAITEN